MGFRIESEDTVNTDHSKSGFVALESFIVGIRIGEERAVVNRENHLIAINRDSELAA